MSSSHRIVAVIFGLNSFRISDLHLALSATRPKMVVASSAIAMGRLMCTFACTFTCPCHQLAASQRDQVDLIARLLAGEPISSSGVGLSPANKSDQTGESVVSRGGGAHHLYTRDQLAQLCFC